MRRPTSPPEQIELPQPNTQSRKRAARDARMASAKEAVGANIAILRKNGLVPKRALGAGSYGMALELQDGRVMKVTTDRQEAQASHKIQGRRGVHVVNVLKAFRFPNSDVYGIVQERLQPLGPVEKHRLGVALRVVDHFIREIGYNVAYGKGWANFTALAKEWSDDVYDRSDVAAAVNTMRRFSLDRMMDEVHARGILFYDYHTENIMKRGDRYVITDLGQSTVHGAIDPLAIEQKGPGRAGVKPGDTTAFEDELLNNRELLIKNNIRPIKFLDHGSRGEAYLCANGDVLKVTMDRSEALASMKALGKDLKTVVSVRKVFAFPGDLGFYGILQERLQPLSNREKSELHSANKVVERILQNRVGAYSRGWDGFIKQVAVNLKAVGLQKGNPHYTRAVDALNVYVKFGLNRMMDEVLSLGVLFADYHIGNVMKRPGGGYVITDLGASKVLGDAGEVPVLEAIDESVSDRVAVVYADLSPFHKDQAQFVRSLAREGKAVLLLRAGSLGFIDLKGVIEGSLPDVEASVEVYDAADRALPEVLRSVFPRSAALRPGVAVTLYSPEAEADADSLRVLGSMVIPKPLPPAAAPRSAPVDREAARASLDPHVFSDSGRAEEVLGALGIEEAVARALVERYLTDMGGVDGATRAIEHNLPKLQRRLRMQTSRFLGAGSKGAVFDIGGNRILKVTSDLKDVSSAMKLKGRRMEHVTTIHDVFQMDPPPGVSVDIYGVVADKVDVLTEDEMNRFNEAFQYVRDAADSDRLLSLLASNRMEEFFDALREDLQSEELQNMQGTSLAKRQRALAELPKKIEGRVRMIWDRLREFKVTDMVEELSSNGVLYADYKGDNLGRRNGEYVLLDVGGKSDGPAPPQLESVNESVAPGTMRVYRATTRHPDDLSITHAGGSDYGPGLYFATDPEDTRPYGPVPREWEVTVKNPIHVGRDEDEALRRRVQRALRIDDEQLMDRTWEELMSLASVLVQMGELRWASLMGFLQKLGYDGIHVHSPKGSRGDYVAVFDSSQVRRPTTVTQELFSPTGQATMVDPSKRSQNTAWSMGDRPHMPSQSYSLTGSDDDRDALLKSQLGYIVRGAIGGLLRK